MNGISDFLGRYDAGTVMLFILGILFLNYIIALYKAHKGTIVVISGWFDLFLVVLPILLIFILSLISNLSGKSNNDEFNQNLLVVYGVVSCIAIFWTLVNSIRSNRGSFVNILISFLAKLFVMLISVIIIFAIFGGSGAEKDARYKDGTKGNQHTKWKAILASICGFLIFSLVYNQRKNIVSTTAENLYNKG